MATWISTRRTIPLMLPGRLRSSDRLQDCIDGRYVTVLKIGEELTCIDSVCFQCGGPLGLGDIKDADGHTCLVCPWDSAVVDVFTGEKYNLEENWQNEILIPGKWASVGARHRIHRARRGDDGLIYVMLDNSSTEMESDKYACDKLCGERVIDGIFGTGAGAVSAVAGADPRFPVATRQQQQQ